jgi:hypothetical protein
VTAAEVLGLTPDGTALLLRVRGETVHLSLEDVRRAERRVQAAPAPPEPLSPRVVQQRIRGGESAEEIARTGDWPVEVVARYEGPVLAEREHHAATARRTEVEGRSVEALVAGHLGCDPEDVSWDSWLVDEGRWEVRATASGQTVRLRWEPAGRRVQALDEAARRALRVPAAEDDVLTSVLRPVAGSTAGAGPRDLRSGRRHRAEVPQWADLWADTAAQTPGREPDA